MSKIQDKVTFKEFMASHENGYDFSKTTKDDLQWAEECILSWKDSMLKETHFGDCTNMCCSCSLCLLELILSEYYTYCIKPDEHNKIYNQKLWDELEEIEKNHGV